MIQNPKRNLTRLAWASTVCLMTSAAAVYGQGAAATISGVPVTGGYDYTIILQDTGTTVLNSFWYGWTADGNNLPSSPSNLGNNVGWDQALFFGNSIEWQNSTGTTLNPGDSAIFTFFSPDSPSAITTDPAGGSVAYVNGIDFSQGSPGSSTPAFSPTLTPAPEPSSEALIGLGAMGLMGAGWRCSRTKK